MIYIVHGDDFAQTRKLIISQQKKLGKDSKIELKLTDISPIKLLESISTFDIFGNAPFTVLDITDAKAKSYDEYIEVLVKKPEQSVVIIQSEKTLGKTNPFIKDAAKLKAKIASTQVKNYGNVFKFIDNLFYKNRKETYKELQTLLNEGNDMFYIFTMLFFGIRNIAHAKFNSTAFASKSAFIKSKAEKQANLYSEEQIVQLFGDIYSIEKKLKTGETSPEIALTLIIEKILV